MITHCDPSELPEAASDDRPQDHMLEAMCPRCNHVVDACCPNCKSHVEPTGADGGGLRDSVLSRSEQYNRILQLLQNARNTKFTLGCFLIATGHAYADGVSMEEYARQWGVVKATVSKQCVFICDYLGIPPSQYMRPVSTKESYRQSNTRPKKIQ